MAFHCLMRCSVIGPGMPAPILTPLRLFTGVMVGLVLAVNASSALYTSKGVKLPSTTGIPNSPAIAMRVDRVMPPSTVLSVDVQRVPCCTKKKFPK